MKKALIIVDVQNDFCEGGTLAVSGAHEIIPYINSLMEDDTYSQIILTQDYHPPHHKSFASHHNKKVGESIILNGIPQFMWPDHCVQGTWGAEFHPQLHYPKASHIIQKGTNPEIDSYSAFQDNHQLTKTGLTDFLRSHDIELVEVAGLALDYCVRATCLDAAQEGFITCLHFQGTRAVNIKPENEKNTLYELIQQKVSILA
ncbi:bifunctional nicotinamidase/pyrazinamidase [Elizabethkingia argentiflava]|uniref:Nicotinamidase n=1 Tax=Elizabethkingia argenteiflava TaxID=2681556 RepID=A0A845PZK0_9FLAO|nr:bifunctional nicotinamidase/pyrazinamidase [Elizabethkingia argenteiflava]NAW51857.1 bifunctional nicotinamidase/pyrazinamidase [Elizabethkingia argenteiflava]